MQLQQAPIHASASRRSFEPLTTRELEVTRWISEGKTSVEIGIILDLSEHTVNEYIRSSMAKLNCSNRMHLISTSIRLGLLA
ncbi:response regulator transcription factor [Rhizobium sp. G21]|uniref:response regulator transcription factor n=1 Tax=Rhizobium sp. G21 TaxID=2758439 RepID=UPI0039181F55